MVVCGLLAALSVSACTDDPMGEALCEKFCACQPEQSDGCMDFCTTEIEQRVAQDPTLAISDECTLCVLDASCQRLTSSDTNACQLECPIFVPVVDDRAPVEPNPS